jgi:hypothetical protein
MSTIIAHSHGPDWHNLRKRYQFLLLDQIWRDASSDPWTWTAESHLSGGGIAEYVNKETGVRIRCEMHGNGHTFTLTEPVDTVPGRSSVSGQESEAL